MFNFDISLKGIPKANEIFHPRVKHVMVYFMHLCFCLFLFVHGSREQLHAKIVYCAILTEVTPELLFLQISHLQQL